jgi:hypothetical protein
VRYQISPPWSRVLIADAAVGHRMSPYFPGHDRRGYRNDDNLDRYDIVAVGDSFTYGFGVGPDASWPRQLRVLSGRPVYNAGVGGYGPCEYRAIVEEMMPLKPAVVVVGLYVGNDLADAYTSAYVAGRCTDLATTSPATLNEMRTADAQGTLRALEASYLKPMGDPEAGRTFVDRLALYGLVRSLADELSATRWNPFLLGGRPDSFGEGCSTAPMTACVVVDAPNALRTVIRDPRADALAVDLDDVRIQEGLRVTESAVDQIANRLRKRRVGLLVVLMHSKPFVMADVIRAQRPDLWPSVERLVGLETRATAELGHGLDRSNVHWVDSGPAVREALASGQIPYHRSADDHPSAAGQHVIAQTIWDAIRAQGVLQEFSR